MTPTGEVCLPAGSDAVLFGESLFSTVSVLEGVPVFLDWHIKRINFSARELGFRARLDPNRLRLALDNLITSDRADTARLRITLFDPGPGEGRVPEHVVLLFAGSRAVDHGAEFFPVNRRNLDPLARHKTGNYQGMRHLLRGLDEGVEALLIDEGGRLLEGARSNLFLGVDEELFTPPREQGILSGVTRGRLLTESRLPTRITELDVDFLERAEEAFLCNSIQGIQPLKRIGPFEFAEVPGPLTRRAMAALETLILADISRWF